MTVQREFKGKDLEEALQEASSALGIAEPDLDYEILEQGRKGLFGLGARNVHIRVMPPVHQISDAALLTADGDDAGAGAEATAPRPPRQRRRRRKRAVEAETETETAAAPAAPETVEAIRATLQKMIELTGLSLAVQAGDSGSSVTLELDGEDKEALTQKDGELLSAFQFLLNRMARRTWPEAQRIQLSCAGHRRRRDDELVELAREVAQQVAQTGRTKRLQQMNAYERRLVHLTVRSYDGLGSRSEGSGYLKKVRIYKLGGQQADASSGEDGAREGGGRRRGNSRRPGRRPGNRRGRRGSRGSEDRRPEGGQQQP